MILAILFYLFAATAVVFALGVVAARSPLYSALNLIGCLFAVAALFALQSAQLIAVFQVLVYAGAIMVMILFVIMLLNLSPRELGRPRINVIKVAGAYFLFTTALVLGVRLAAQTWLPAQSVDDRFGSIESVGELLYRTYLLPFEMVSLLLLGAIIGAVLLTRKLKGDGS
jgi:NADH-quinone oxidoreductase subunit J